MKTILATLNAKYIHNSLALRLLYVANKDRFDICFREYTIKENIETIAHELLSTGSNCIGLGVYIWNVELTKKLISKLREKKPNLIIILGGPEVTYEPEYFLNATAADYVISGEAEFVLGKLLHALENNLSTNIESVSSKKNISSVVAQADIDKLIALPSPYQLQEDLDILPHKVIYFETSRGCPYNCAYCLSSLEKGVRYFPKEYIFENLDYLIQHKVKLIKFLDRTFNLNKQHTQNVFQFLINQYRTELSCQFEIYADILDEPMIHWLNTELPKNYFRFEIGIQSTFEASNQAVNRKQNFSLLSQNIHKLLQGGKIDFHLDLIAGLPFETFQAFVKSFNDVFAFGAKELQLGFLKMLRGTALRTNAEEHGYTYQEEAPYQVISNNYITHEELERIHVVEHILEKYWNSGRFKATMKELFTTFYLDNYFGFFEEFGLYCQQQQHKLYKYQLEDLFRYLHLFLLLKEIDVFELLRSDYYNSFSIRPTIFFWQDTLEKKERKRLLNEISLDKEFLKKYQLSAYNIKKQTCIDKLSEENYQLTVFRGLGCEKFMVNKIVSSIM